MLTWTTCYFCGGGRFIKVKSNRHQLCRVCRGDGCLLINREIPSQLIKDVLGLFSEKQARKTIKNKMDERKNEM